MDGGLSALYSVYAALGGFVVFFGLTSLFVKERLYLTESLVATLFGIALGKHGLGVVVPNKWWGEGSANLEEQTHFYTILHEAARIVISMQVMAAGVSTPGGFLKRHWRSVCMMLGPVMLVMWGVSGAAVHYTLGMPWAQAMTIAACVTPTDPVLAMSVIKGKFAERYIPTRLRNLLAIESGANDGLGYPFMMLPILLMQKNYDWSAALTEWTVTTWLRQIVGSVVLGVVIGFTARTLLIQSIKRHLIDKESFLVFSLALALVVTGVGAWLRCDDLLAVFIAGNAFAWDGDAFMDKNDESHINGVIDLVFNISFFVIFGATIPWASFVDQDGLLLRLTLCALLILLFRRLPGVTAMLPLIPALQTRKEAFFAGWFGPMGVGAIFFAIEARHEMLGKDLDFALRVYPTVTFIVLSSIMIHGITVPLTNSSLKRRMRIKAMRATRNAANLMSVIDQAERRASADKKGTDTTAAEEVLRAVAANDATVRSADTAFSQDYSLSPPDSPRDEYIYLTDDEDGGPLDLDAGDESSPEPRVHRRRRRVLVMDREDLENRGVSVPDAAPADVILVSAVSPDAADTARHASDDALDSVI